MSAALTRRDVSTQRWPHESAPELRTTLLALIHQPHYLTMREARAYTGLGPTLLETLRRSGRVRAIVDGKVKFYRPDLDSLTPEDLIGGEE